MCSLAARHRLNQVTESRTPVVASNRAVTWVAVVAAIWGLSYAAYRGYYALGGTAWLPGAITDPTTFRLINAVAVIALLLAAAMPIATLQLWRRRMLRRLLLVACWIVAVGCVMHAIIDIVQQCLSLAGVLSVQGDSAVLLLDPRTAALQDIFFNEPWFLVEGILFAVLACMHLRGRARLLWLTSAGTAVAVLVVFGLLVATGVLGRAIIG
jgi:hypothetical protein